MRTKLMILIAASLGLSHAATAADIPARMPTKAPVMAPVVTHWTGCYIGVNGGYGWARKEGTDIVGPLALGSHTADGGVFGGQVGCDWQFNQTWVLGARGMWDWADLRGSNTIPTLTDTFHTDVRSFGTAVARGGWVVNPSWMIYAVGGVACANDRHHLADVAGVTLATARSTRTGYVVGGGVEWMINPGWSVFAEYNYMDFGTRRLNFADAVGLFPVDVRQDMSVFMVGLNWRWAAGRAVGPGRW